MRRLLARLSMRGAGAGGNGEGSEGSSSDEETGSILAEMNYSETIKPMAIATNMQLPVYNNDYLKSDSTTRYYCANSMQYTENSHMYAALVGNEIFYFPSDYMGVSHRKQILCCKLSSSLKDKAADTNMIEKHRDFRVTTEIFNTTYTCKDNVKQENNVLFRALCTDEEKHLVYSYGGSIFTFERSPTNNFHIFNAKNKEYSLIELKDSENLPKLEGHTLIRRDANTFYTFGGLLEKAFCNKIFEFNIKTGEWREVIATNHDQVKPRSYHVGQYVKKHDVMVIVSGKLKVGQYAPMTDEILIYHFKENRFQIITNSPTPFHKIPACHVIHSCNLTDNQFAFYGGCKTTDYNVDEDYDPHLFVFTFNNRTDKKSTDLTPVVSMFNLQERIPSCYTTIVYHRKFKCFVLLGANAGQRKDRLSFFYLDPISYNNPIEAFVNMKSVMDFEDHSRLQDVTLHCTH
ncbi:predicted protein [Naegleria gruberi]|uniref:Predicted protein n=1 Tax=Naegleria gruberi TaxID=5762 RepID=D2VNQ4_NAEGR|nr:uncharacterized protein NAEGRDRAFT_51055 [Naegleria gruberi]EFC41449.1 predicted protein [Naegleria gruberi]|eukprot:XP_002674193.1 predicted protein [Naegleria gruberi strain NEG-M]